MAIIDNEPAEYNPNARYRDALGLEHGTLTRYEAVELKNIHLQDALAAALVENVFLKARLRIAEGAR